MKNYWLDKRERRDVPTIIFKDGIITNLEELLCNQDWAKFNWTDAGGFCTESRHVIAWLNEEDAVTRSGYTDDKFTIQNITRFYGFVTLRDSHTCNHNMRHISIRERTSNLFLSTIIESHIENDENVLSKHRNLYDLPLLPGQSRSACDTRVRYDPNDADLFPGGDTDLRTDYSKVNMNYGKETNDRRATTE